MIIKDNSFNFFFNKLFFFFLEDFIKGAVGQLLRNSACRLDLGFYGVFWCFYPKIILTVW